MRRVAFCIWHNCVCVVEIRNRPPQKKKTHRRAYFEFKKQPRVCSRIAEPTANQLLFVHAPHPSVHILMASHCISARKAALPPSANVCPQDTATARPPPPPRPAAASPLLTLVFPHPSVKGGGQVCQETRQMAEDDGGNFSEGK